MHYVKERKVTAGSDACNFLIIYISKSEHDFVTKSAALNSDIQCEAEQYCSCTSQPVTEHSFAS